MSKAKIKEFKHRMLRYIVKMFCITVVTMQSKEIVRRNSPCTKANEVFSILNPSTLLFFFFFPSSCRYLQAMEKIKKTRASTKSATVYVISRNIPSLDRSLSFSFSLSLHWPDIAYDSWILLIEPCILVAYHYTRSNRADRFVQIVSLRNRDYDGYWAFYGNLDCNYHRKTFAK